MSHVVDMFRCFNINHDIHMHDGIGVGGGKGCRRVEFVGGAGSDKGGIYVFVADGSMKRDYYLSNIVCIVRTILCLYINTNITEYIPFVVLIYDCICW